MDEYNSSNNNSDTHLYCTPNLQDDGPEPSGSNLGDLRTIFSFLNLERAAIAENPFPQQQEQQHQHQQPQEVGLEWHRDETWPEKGGNPPSDTTTPHNGSILGDISRLLRYLQAHKSTVAIPQQELQELTPTPTPMLEQTQLMTLKLSPPVNAAIPGMRSKAIPELAWSCSSTGSSSSDTGATPHRYHMSRDEEANLMLASPDMVALPTQDVTAVKRTAITDPSQGNNSDTLLDDDDHRRMVTANTRRRAKKSSARRGLPIDEPSSSISSSSSGVSEGLSSESDHNNSCNDSKDEDLELPKVGPKRDTPINRRADSGTESSAEKKRHESKSIKNTDTAESTRYPMDNNVNGCNNNGNNMTITGPKKRPWRSARALKEMKALFATEQEAELQRLQTLQRLKEKEQKERKEQEQLSGKPLNRKARRTAEWKRRLQELEDSRIESELEHERENEHEYKEYVYEQLPGCEPVISTHQSRTNYKDFWKTVALEQDKASSSAEAPVLMSSSKIQVDLSLTTSVPLQRPSEEQNTMAERLLLLCRDTFLVPKKSGASLLSRALANDGGGPINSVMAAEETNVDETGCPAHDVKVTTDDTAIPTDESLKRPIDIWKEDEEHTEEEVAPSDRVFIFVDNSNILTGFYHYCQKHAAVNRKDETTSAEQAISVPTPSATATVGPLPEENHKVNDKCQALDTTVDDQEQYDTDPEEETVLYPRRELRPRCKGLGDNKVDTIKEDHESQDTTTEQPPVPTESSVGLDHRGHLQTESQKQATPWSSSPPSSGARMVKGKFPKFNYGAFFNALKRKRNVSRRVLVGSSPLFQELDEALEHRYETIILRRVRKFVQGELGAVPIPVKQPRYPSTNLNINNNLAPSSVQATLPDKYGPTTGHVMEATKDDLIQTNSATKGEQGVDELLHLKMLETLLDHEPATMVLATGDGGDSEFGGGGFYGVIKRALDRGWQVEVVSWEEQLSGVYLELALEYGYGQPRRFQPGSKKYNRSGYYQQNRYGPARRGHLRVWCLDWFGDHFFQA